MYVNYKFCHFVMLVVIFIEIIINDNEYANWSYSKRVSNCIRQEVEHCRNECAIFDLTSFGKVCLQTNHK